MKPNRVSSAPASAKPAALTKARSMMKAVTVARIKAHQDGAAAQLCLGTGLSLEMKLWTRLDDLYERAKSGRRIKQAAVERFNPGSADLQAGEVPRVPTRIVRKCRMGLAGLLAAG
jgi:hypothetical protein